jgi:hypothetical protein
MYDNIKMDLREIDRGCVNFIPWAQGSDQWRALDEYGHVPSGCIKGGEFLHKLRPYSLLKNLASWNLLRCCIITNCND